MLLRFIALIIGMPFLGFSLAITIMLIKTGIHYEQKKYHQIHMTIWMLIMKSI